MIYKIEFRELKKNGKVGIYYYKSKYPLTEQEVEDVVNKKFKGLYRIFILNTTFSKVA